MIECHRRHRDAVSSVYVWIRVCLEEKSSLLDDNVNRDLCLREYRVVSAIGPGWYHCSALPLVDRGDPYVICRHLTANGSAGRFLAVGDGVGNLTRARGDARLASIYRACAGAIVDGRSWGPV